MEPKTKNKTMQRFVRCHGCKRLGHYRITFDPFVQEIHNKKIRTRLCSGCYQKALDEI